VLKKAALLTNLEFCKRFFYFLLGYLEIFQKAKEVSFINF